MAKTDYKTINEYHESQPEELQNRMQTVRDIIHEVVPDVEEAISYQIPCFKYQGYLIYYAAFAKHITLSHPYSEAFLEKFQKELSGLKLSKAAIQFPNSEPLPVGFIKRIIQFRKKENEEAAKAKAKK